MATDFIMPRMPTASRDAFYQQPHHRHPQQQVPAFNQQYTYAAAANAAATASNFASQYNPQISPLSTSNSGSPNSSKPINSNNGNYHTRQARPLYIPAVLRPNEHPSREGQAKGGNASDHSSGNSSAVGDGSEDDDDQDDDSQTSRRSGGLRSSGSFISLPGLGAFGIGLLSRRSTNDSGKCVDTNWNLDQFPDVTGFPSRSHWKVCIN